MTKSNDATTTTTIEAKEIGMTDDAVKSLHHFMVVERANVSSTFLKRWIEIGDVCNRIKALKAKGKFSDNVNAFFGTVLSNDERQYSMKLHDNADAINKWYNDKGCMKYNPRTIWTAYQNDVNPKPKKEKGGKTDEETDGQELRKERFASDVLEAYTNFSKVFDNAVENGNMESKDYEALLGNLKATLADVQKMAAFEKSATTKTAKTAKKAKTKKVA